MWVCSKAHYKLIGNKYNCQEAAGPVGYLQSVVEFSSGLPKTNPASGREKDSNPGPKD